MATSGSVDFSVTRDDLIKSALQYIEMIGEGVTPNSTQITECSQLLNMIVKTRVADGMPLWAIKTGWIFPQTEISEFSIGPSGSGHASLNYTLTTTTATSGIAGATITVDNTTGFADTNNIGIELSSGNMHWTTVSGTPAGSVITLTTVLPENVAVGAQVYGYVTKLERPLRILDAFIFDVLSNTRQPINIISTSDFFGLGDTTSESEPNQLAYQPSLINGIVRISPRFLTGDKLIQIRYHRPFEDFDAANDTPDFPQEFYLPLMLELASLCGAKYGVPLQERRLIQQEAQFYFEKALSNGTEEASLLFQPTPIR